MQVLHLILFIHFLSFVLVGKKKKSLSNREGHQAES